MAETQDVAASLESLLGVMSETAQMFTMDTSDVESIQAFKSGRLALQKRWIGKLQPGKALIAALTAQENQLQDLVNVVKDEPLRAELSDLTQAKLAAVKTFSELESSQETLNARILQLETEVTALRKEKRALVATPPVILSARTSTCLDLYEVVTGIQWRPVGKHPTTIAGGLMFCVCAVLISQYGSEQWFPSRSVSFP